MLEPVYCADSTRIDRHGGRGVTAPNLQRCVLSFLFLFCTASAPRSTTEPLPQQPHRYNKGQMAVTRGKTRAAKAKGGLVKQAMTLIALASSAFILLPAGRDIVSYETFILPGEAETRPLMTMAHSSSRTGMWGAPRSA